VDDKFKAVKADALDVANSIKNMETSLAGVNDRLSAVKQGMRQRTSVDMPMGQVVQGVVEGVLQQDKDEEIENEQKEECHCLRCS